MTFRGDGEVTRSDLAFSEFIYQATAQWNTSSRYRRRLLNEKPGMERTGPRRECPASHRHGETATCYQLHRCSCTNCRTEATRRAKGYRLRRAVDEWQAQNHETRSTA